MKFNLMLIAAIAAVGLASPSPQAMQPGMVLPRAQGERARSKHNHRVPDLRLPCDCPPVNCPEALIKDKKSLCACKQNHAQMCSFRSNGGCQAPRLRSC